MTASSPETELTREATFIFKGTVRKLKAATIASVPGAARTAVVRVDEVLQSPKLLAGYEGREVTVELEPGHRAKEGQSAIFYTNNMRFGDSITVQAVGHTDAGAPSAALAAPERDTQVEAAETRELEAHLEDADLVVTGKVLSVSLASEQGGRAGRGLSATSRLSEHSACWREAVVAVSQVEKGQPAVRQLVIRFPGSEDVAWVNAPKFQPGQEGVFILRKAEPDKEANRSKRAAGDDQGPIYTALHAHDFQPVHQAERIKALIRAAAPKRSVRQTPAGKRR